MVDLDKVVDQVRYCRSLLPESPGIEQDESLYQAIGYLEACHDRLLALAEAGVKGLLPEDVFSKTLKVLEAVVKTLDAEKVCFLLLQIVFHYNVVMFYYFIVTSLLFHRYFTAISLICIFRSM